MTDDIVLQLRDTRYPGQMEMRLEAADQIERLRTALEIISKYSKDDRAAKAARIALSPSERGSQ